MSPSPIITSFVANCSHQFLPMTILVAGYVIEISLLIIESFEFIHPDITAGFIWRPAVLLLNRFGLICIFSHLSPFLLLNAHTGTLLPVHTDQCVHVNSCYRKSTGPSTHTKVVALWYWCYVLDCFVGVTFDFSQAMRQMELDTNYQIAVLVQIYDGHIKTNYLKNNTNRHINTCRAVFPRHISGLTFLMHKHFYDWVV